MTEFRIRGEALNAVKCVHGSADKALDFSSNVNPLGCSPRVMEALKNVDVDAISKYPDDSYSELKSAIAKKEKVKIENVVLGNGSTELIYLFCYLFIKNGSPVKIFSPTFSEYEKACKLFGGRINAGIENEMTFICNPNNPTSKLWDRQLVEEQSGTLFLDETFMEFTGNDKKSVLEDRFTIKSFTKIYGLAGLRLGYGLGDEKLIERMEKVRPPWNVNSFAAIAAAEAMGDRDHIRKTLELIKNEKKYLFKELTGLSYDTEMPDANFFYVGVRSASQLEKGLLERGIAVRNCGSFTGMKDEDRDRYVRVAIKRRDENERLISALGSLDNDHGSDSE